MGSAGFYASLSPFYFYRVVAARKPFCVFVSCKRQLLSNNFFIDLNRRKVCMCGLEHGRVDLLIRHVRDVVKIDIIHRNTWPSNLSFRYFCNIRRRRNKCYEFLPADWLFEWSTRSICIWHELLYGGVAQKKKLRHKNNKRKTWLV